jgi:uncharacterized protein YbaR (Trm112 family)
MTQSSESLDDLWRCPQCRGKLQRITDALLCSEATCRLSYPVVDSIPVMLIDQASELSSDDWQSALNPNNGAGS